MIENSTNEDFARSHAFDGLRTYYQESAKILVLWLTSICIFMLNWLSTCEFIIYELKINAVYYTNVIANNMLEEIFGSFKNIFEVQMLDKVVAAHSLPQIIC